LKERITIALYDLESNKYRKKSQSSCENHGLKRFQYSGYMGKLPMTLRRKLFDEIRKHILMSKKSGRVLVMPVCELDFESAFLFEEAEEVNEEDDRYLC